MRLPPSAVLTNLTALAAALLLTACGRRETAVTAGIRDQVLLIGNGAEPEDLDPHIVTGVPEYRLVSALFEGLTAYDPTDLTPVPGVAARWDISPDHLTYTFHLRTDARWSNGDPVTAHDFSYAWRRVLSPALGNRYTYLYDGVRGAADFYAGRVPWEEVGIRALDDHTFEVELLAPIPYLPGLLTHNTFYPVHRATIEAHGRMDQRGTPWTRPGNLVGNGAFLLHEWRHNAAIEVRPNPHYWEADTVRLAAVRFFPMESADTEDRAYRAGQLHVTGTIPSHLVPRLRDSGAPELRLAPLLGVYYYELNHRRPPLDDARVRRALSLALDRTALVTAVTQGGEQPAQSFIHPGLLGGDAGPTFTEDLADARRLLADAGFPDGAGFPRLEIVFNTLESHRAIAETIQQMWRRNLGIDLLLTNQEWQVYLGNRRAHQFDLARAGWVASYQDGTVFSNLLMTDSGNNHTGWSNPAYDRLATAVRHEPDPAERLRLFHAASALLNADMPVIPLYFYTSKRLVHPAVRGWHDTLLDIHPLKNVYLQE